MNHNVQKNIFFIPYWVKTILERNGQPLNTVLNLPRLSEFLSSEDLATVVVLNRNSEKFFGFKEDYFGVIENYWHNGAGFEKYTNHVEPLLALVEKMVDSRLFTQEAFEDKYLTPFVITDIEASVLLIVIYPGYFCEPTKAAVASDMMRNLLKLFYAYEGFDAVARRTIFDRYVDSLSQHQV